MCLLKTNGTDGLGSPVPVQNGRLPWTAARTVLRRPAEPLSVAQGGRGVVAGCPTCKKRINSIQQFLDHLTKDAMPALLDQLAAKVVLDGNGDAQSFIQGVRLGFYAESSNDKAPLREGTLHRWGRSQSADEPARRKKGCAREKDS
jgi:hypothetical protein